MRAKNRTEWVESAKVGEQLPIATMPLDTGLIDLIDGVDDRVQIERDPTATPIGFLGYGVTIIRVK